MLTKFSKLSSRIWACRVFVGFFSKKKSLLVLLMSFVNSLVQALMTTCHSTSESDTSARRTKWSSTLTGEPTIQKVAQVKHGETYGSARNQLEDFAATSHFWAYFLIQQSSNKSYWHSCSHTAPEFRISRIETIDQIFMDIFNAFVHKIYHISFGDGKLCTWFCVSTSVRQKTRYRQCMQLCSCSLQATKALNVNTYIGLNSTCPTIYHSNYEDSAGYACRSVRVLCFLSISFIYS